ncbi:MAG: hypothetical protein PHW73_10510 [Atribacterota bacterium]|nr:hypothetical protein [Atribacterota bacterium]
MKVYSRNLISYERNKCFIRFLGQFFIGHFVLKMALVLGLVVLSGAQASNYISIKVDKILLKKICYVSFSNLRLDDDECAKIINKKRK